MNILLSNDDGYRAPWLRALATALAEIANVTVVAPQTNKSGASSSLTLDRALTVSKADSGYFYVDGTPADCVHVAVTSWLDVTPDIVVAGINKGSNVADDVVYSGTIAAAIEGRFLGLPAIAVSLDGSKHFDVAAAYATDVVLRMARQPLPDGTILNVNVPDLEADKVKGVTVTRQGSRVPPQPAYRCRQSSEEEKWWIGSAGGPNDQGEGTDLHALRQGMVSVTPLHIDMTRHDLLDDTARWLST